jgi:hypothetical protein
MLEDFNETPTLGFTERAGFHDADAIPDLGFIFFVMGMELSDMLRDFSEFWMRNTGHRTNHDGFVHLIGYDLADSNLAERAMIGIFGSDCFCHVLLFIGCLGILPAEDGFNAGDVATSRTDEVGFLELGALLLDAKVENFLLQLAFAGEKFFRGEFLDFLNLHGVISWRGDV